MHLGWQNEIVVEIMMLYIKKQKKKKINNDNLHVQKYKNLSITIVVELLCMQIYLDNFLGFVCSQIPCQCLINQRKW